MEEHNCFDGFLAIIFACYNRIEKTRRCIDSLEKQLAGFTIQYKFYICDDNSTDGTLEMLQSRLPKSRIIRTKGNYFWSKSMYVAMMAAKEDNPDYYLMINDDVVFDETAVRVMLDSYNAAGRYPCGVVGTTVSAFNGKVTYGGRNDDNGEIIKPSNDLNTCKVANWNCFLIDKETVSKVGIIDGKYAHSGGDYDYCYRMKKEGIPIYVAYSCIGCCEVNNFAELFKSAEYSRMNRLKAYFSRKGPPRSTIRYNYRTKGIRVLRDLVVGVVCAVTMILQKKELP